MTEAEFTLPAVHCDGCFTGIEMASRLEKGITGVRGIKGSKNAVIAWDDVETDRDSVVEWLKGLGYEPAPSTT